MGPNEIWKYALLAVITAVAFGHFFLPRYEWRTVGDERLTIVVYDRWTGRFQRAVYDDKGNLNVMGVYTPF